LLYTYSVVWALLIIVVIFSLMEPDSFFTAANARSILGSQAILLILTLGLILPLSVGEFDLSIASVAAFSQVILGVLTVNEGWPLWAGLLVAVGASALIGFLNAMLVVKLGVASFITTLGMGTLLDGLSVKISGSSTIPGISRTLVDIAGHRVLGVQAVFWYGLVLAVVIWYVLRWTPLGQWLYFTGANREMARLNGVPTSSVRIGALIASATIAGVAGVLYAGVFGSADPFSGRNFLLPAFAAAFLGSTAFTPGRFNAWGTFFAVYLVITGIVGLSLVTGEVGWLSLAFNGAVLIAAVAAQRVVSQRRDAAKVAARRSHVAGQVSAAPPAS
jgi:ribose transport system permease protein